MFCDKCGNQLRDGAKFCDVCGTSIGGADNQPVNQGFVQNTPQNMMYTQPVYMAPVQTARKPKSRAWIIIIIAVVVAAGIGVGLFFLFQPKNPTLTVNGENIPVEVSGYYEISDLYSYCGVIFVGKKGNDKYLVSVVFPGGNPSADKTYDPKGTRNAIVRFIHKNEEEKIYCDITTDSSIFTEATVSVGDYSENEKISISVSGEISNNDEYYGLEYKFSFGGNAEFCVYRDLMARVKEKDVIGR